jgi:lipase
VVFLHSGVGSAGEWREIFSLWPEGHHLIAVDAYRGGTGPGVPGQPLTLDDFADQVHAVVQQGGEPVHLIGFSWGGATALRLAATAPEVLASVAVIEPEAYSLLKAEDGPGAAIRELRDGWREHIRAGNWYEAFEDFVDFYNGPGSFAKWPAARRDAFLDAQRARGDLWDVLFHAPITAGSLASMTMPVHVVEGSGTTVVDHAICEVLLENLPWVEHSVIDGAGHMMPLTHAADLSRQLVRHLPKPGQR